MVIAGLVLEGISTTFFSIDTNKGSCGLKGFRFASLHDGATKISVEVLFIRGESMINKWVSHAESSFKQHIKLWFLGH